MATRVSARKLSSPLPLVELCHHELVQLLVKERWRNTAWYQTRSRECNPFASLASSLVDRLMVLLLEKLTLSGTIESQLRPLVTSGQLRNVRIYVSINFAHDVGPVLQLLASHADHLRTLSLYVNYKYLYFVDINHSELILDLRTHIVGVLESAPNLQTVSTNFTFNLRSLLGNKGLKELRLMDFPTTVRGLLPQDGGIGISLMRYFHKYCQKNIIRENKDVIIDLLLELSELRVLECDVGEALELLHGEQVHLSETEIKYHLAAAFLVPKSPAQIQIFTNVCPFIMELSLYINVNEILENVYLLSELELLKSLSFNTTETSGVITCDFSYFVPLLQNIGGQLTSLTMFCSVKHLDIGTLASLCPELLQLRIEIFSEDTPKEIPNVMFKSLEILYISYLEENYKTTAIKPDSLLLFLSCCFQLQILEVHFVHYFNDTLMYKILIKNSLTNLKSATINTSNLTENGLVQLASNATSLRFLTFSSEHVHIYSRTLREKVSSVNPLTSVSDY